MLYISPLVLLLLVILSTIDLHPIVVVGAYILLLFSVRIYNYRSVNLNSATFNDGVIPAQYDTSGMMHGTSTNYAVQKGFQAHSLSCHHVYKSFVCVTVAQSPSSVSHMSTRLLSVLLLYSLHLVLYHLCSS